MRIDLHCPVETRGYELTRDDRGKTRAYVRLFNLSGRRVRRLEGQVHFEGPEGEQSLPLAQDVDAAPRQMFTLALALPGSGEGLWLSFTKLRFEDGRADWIGHPSRLIQIPDMPAPDGRELNRLMAVAGRDAVCFPRRTGAYWVCVCGRPNAYRRQRCARCGRQRDQVLTRCSMAQVMEEQPLRTPSGDAIELPLMAPPPAQAPGEDSPIQQLHRRFLRQRSMLLRRTLTMLVIALLLLLAAWLAAPGRPAAPIHPPGEDRTRTRRGLKAPPAPPRLRAFFVLSGFPSPAIFPCVGSPIPSLFPGPPLPFLFPELFSVFPGSVLPNPAVPAKIRPVGGRPWTKIDQKTNFPHTLPY